MISALPIRQQRRIIAFALLIPAIALVTAMIILPELWAVFLSFTNFRLGRPLRFIGIENYRYLFSDSQFWYSTRITLAFVFFSVVLQMFFGLAVALLLAGRFPLQRLWISLILTPIALTPSVLSAMWRYLLDFHIGPFNYLISMFGFARQSWLGNDVFALWVIILVYVWQSTPYVFLFLYPSRITFPATLYEAAHIDGASAFQCLMYITLPLLKPVMIVALIFRTTYAFRNFGLVWTLTEGGPVGATEVLAVYLFREGFKYWRFGSAAAIAVVLLVFTLIAASHQIRTMQRTMFS